MNAITGKGALAQQWASRYNAIEISSGYKLPNPRPGNWRDAAVEASNITAYNRLMADFHDENQWKIDEAIAILTERNYKL